MKYFILFFIVFNTYFYFDIAFDFSISIWFSKFLKKPLSVFFTKFSTFLIDVFNKVDFKNFFMRLFNFFKNFLRR